MDKIEKKHKSGHDYYAGKCAHAAYCRTGAGAMSVSGVPLYKQFLLFVRDYKRGRFSETEAGHRFTKWAMCDSVMQELFQSLELHLQKQQSAVTLSVQVFMTQPLKDRVEGLKWLCDTCFTVEEVDDATAGSEE